MQKLVNYITLQIVSSKLCTPDPLATVELGINREIQITVRDQIENGE